jgi:pilus assembly protein Flp/PilA
MQMSKLTQFFQDESGASAAEYALILAIVGLGIVAAVGSLRNAISSAIDKTATTISTNAT